MDTQKTFRYAWQPYIVATVLIAVAAALRLWPLQDLRVRLAWLTFYPAVMVAALYGGLAAGLLGTLLSCLTILYLWPVLVAQPFIVDSADWLGLAVFCITCAMISSVAEAMRRASAQAKQAKEQLEVANTALAAANKELAATNNDLEAANKELEAFSYSVSHDLRAPLRAIDGFSRILLEEHAGHFVPEALRYINLVRDNTRQMGTLVDDLLTLSRLSRQPLRKQPVQMTALVRQSIDELRAETNGRRVEFTVGDPSADAGQALPVCQADPRLLKQVWINLLSNALKYTRKRDLARIDIGWTKGNDEQVFSVNDNGVGFDMEYVGKLFGTFQRLHRSEDYEGTGVGLAIVQRIVHRHGGRVWAEGRVDDGATFHFSLPWIEPAAPPQVSEPVDEVAERARELV